MHRKGIADIMCKISSFGEITFYNKIQYKNLFILGVHNKHISYKGYYIPFPRPTYARKIDFLQSVKFKTSVGAIRGV